MTVPFPAAWIGVPVGTPMSIPGWSVPQRIPNGLVIGPDKGHAKPLLDGGSDDEPAVATLPACVELARSFAASWALADSSAFDSWISSSTCLRVITRARLLSERAPASLPLLESNS